MFLAVAIAVSVGTWVGPLTLADYLESWWWLAVCALTVPVCEACWRAGDRPGEAA
jgi:hypothetical protein